MSETSTPAVPSAGRTTTGPETMPEPASSLGRLFYDRVAATPDAEAYRYPVGEEWESVTWAQAMEAVRTIAALPLPKTDPISGKADGVVEAWARGGI